MLPRVAKILKVKGGRYEKLIVETYLSLALSSGCLSATTPAFSSTWFVKNSKTLIALIETIVPGKKFDPTGAPGGMEAKTFLYLQKVEKENFFLFQLTLLKV